MPLAVRRIENASRKLKDSSKRNSYDVIVVGLGPTGATLANLLGRAGLRVLALDRYHEPYPLPRAIHFDDEVMRIFQTAGLPMKYPRSFGSISACVLSTLKAICCWIGLVRKK